MSIVKSLVKPVGRNVRDLMLICGVGPKLDEQDRRVLDEKIFPYLLGREDLKRVLFVGCHWYTWHYKKIFADKHFWTLEIDPARKRYGAKQHIVDSVEHVDQHFEENSLDAVLMLGVMGWGLDDPEVANRSVEHIHRCLRPDGVLINSWDDVPEHRPFPIAELPAFGRFALWAFPPFEAARFVCEQQDLQHTFDFYTATK